MTMMDVLNYANGADVWFKNAMRENGKESKTTFYLDFTIADCCGGVKAIKDTYKRAMASWKNDVEYMAEFVVALNWKIWQHYNNGKHDIAKVYDELWRKAHNYCVTHFKDEDLSYYYDFVD
jgi:hypothetical protein